MDRQAAILLNAIILMLMAWATAVAGQSAPEKDARDKAATSEATGSSPSQKRPILLNAPPVSTERAAREAASKSTQQSEPTRDAGAAEDSEVVELRPTSPDTHTAGSAATVPPADPKKSKRKNIHGSVYGSASAMDSRTHHTGGSVGASSKGGKAHIYVESERARQTSPTPR